MLGERFPLGLLGGDGGGESDDVLARTLPLMCQEGERSELFGFGE